jgi:hypothetical protein
MRVTVIVKANKNSEAGKMPSKELLTAMGNYNDALAKAGVMLAGEGLHPTARGKRVRFDDGAEVELRPVFEADDFGAEFTRELREQEGQGRAEECLHRAARPH